jgi:hypothetical protein
VKHKDNFCKSDKNKLKEIPFITSNKINVISINEIEGVKYNQPFYHNRGHLQFLHSKKRKYTHKLDSPEDADGKFLQNTGIYLLSPHGITTQKTNTDSLDSVYFLMC